MATLKDIAEDAHVSTATVSMVLNNKGNISEITKEKVNSSVRKFNYKKKLSHQLSINNNNKTIKFLRISKHGHVVNRDHDVFIADYLDGLTKGADTYGLKLEVNSYTKVSIEHIVEAVLGDNHNIDGAVILATELTEEDMKEFLKVNIPLVFIDNYNEFLPFDYVDMDNSSSIHMVYNNIKQKGYTNIGFISGYPEIANFKLRKEAYLADLSKDNKKPNIISVDSTHTGAYEDMKKIIKDLNGNLMPIYICANDIIALGAMRALTEYGFKVPQDVALVGFDNLPIATQLYPSLSSVEVSKRKIAHFAVQILYDRIKNPNLPNVRILVGGKFIKRESISSFYE